MIPQPTDAGSGLLLCAACPLQSTTVLKNPVMQDNKSHPQEDQDQQEINDREYSVIVPPKGLRPVFDSASTEL